MIINAEQLKPRLSNNSVQILDVRSYQDYSQGHIPGAIHFDPAQANASKPPINGLLPDSQAFTDYAKQLGLDQTSVLVYDQQAGTACGRVAWTLLAFGHTKVSILNGGYEAWLSLGFEIEQTEPKPGNGTFQAQRVPELIADKHYILSKLHQDSMVLMDVRSLEEYQGHDIRSARGGHIPGAVHLNWTDSKDPSKPGYFKPEQTLKKILKDKGITPDKEIIVYCQTHQRSALMGLLLGELGYKRVKGYPGAWSDWGNAQDTPCEA